MIVLRRKKTGLHEEDLSAETRATMHRCARGGGRAAAARLFVPELLDAPVLLRDLRLEFVYASLRTLKHALHLGLVREG